MWRFCCELQAVSCVSVLFGVDRGSCRPSLLLVHLVPGAYRIGRVALINPLQPSGNYMYRQFNIQQFYVLPTQCIYGFCVDLRTNSDYFPIQH
jgi:hypothetical protein